MASSGSVKSGTAALESLIEELESDRSFEEPNWLRERIDALDRLDAYLSWGQSSSHASVATANSWVDRAKRISTKLESLNQELYRSIRHEIREGVGRNALLRWCFQRKGSGPDILAGQSYDYLDELVSGVLQFDEPSDGIGPLEAEMVFYQPTPARHIFDLVRRTALNERDLFIDLGSGMGHVPLVVSICAKSRCIGIEIEPSYVRCSLKCAQALNLNNVTFMRGDARAADLSQGTVFYLYTPFVGSMLHAMLDLLQREALRREIRVCTFGPCASVVSKEPWLKPVGPMELERIAVFCSRCTG